MEEKNRRMYYYTTCSGTGSRDFAIKHRKPLDFVPLMSNVSSISAYRQARNGKTLRPLKSLHKLFEFPFIILSLPQNPRLLWMELFKSGFNTPELYDLFDNPHEAGHLCLR